jgi:hypothetical protein
MKSEEVVRYSLFNFAGCLVAITNAPRCDFEVNARRQPERGQVRLCGWAEVTTWYVRWQLDRCANAKSVRKQISEAD